MGSKALKTIIAAWDLLPAGAYPVIVIQDWLYDMADTIADGRDELDEGAEATVLPFPSPPEINQ